MKLIITAVTIIVLLQACAGKALQKKVTVNTDVIAVKLTQVGHDSATSNVQASGLLATENEARLSFKIGGIIQNVLVEEGQTVKKGQLLALLISDEIAAQVEQVNLSITKAQRDYQRTLNLFQDSVATLEQLQNAKTGVDIARQSLQQAAFNQQYSKIYAPANGFVVKRSGNAGELANAGDPVIIMNIVSNQSKWVLKVGLPDIEWAGVKSGDKAVVHFDAYPGETFSAVVSKRSFAADPVSGSFQIELEINPGKHLPAAGMFGKATIFPGHFQNRVSIPYEALLEANGKQGYVFVSDDRKTVKKFRSPSAISRKMWCTSLTGWKDILISLPREARTSRIIRK